VGVIKAKAWGLRNKYNPALAMRRNIGRRLLGRAIHFYRNLLPVPVQLLRHVRVVVNIHGDLLSFLEAKEWSGELAVVATQ
jgi:hypothetical protein